MKIWNWLLVLFISLQSSAQTITTFAGTGSSVFSGIGVPATSAGIPNPSGIVFDRQGNCYIVDGLNSFRVRKITPSGIISTIAGTGMGGYIGDGGPATAARLGGPGGIDLDTAGNLYFADPPNNRIRRIDMATGIITTIAGTGAGSYGGDGGLATLANLYNPQDVRVDAMGNIYIGAFYDNRIRKIDASGIINTIAGGGSTVGLGDGGPATAAHLVAPWGVEIDGTGNVYLAQTAGSTLSNRIRKIDTAGIITTIAGNGAWAYTGDGIPATAATMGARFLALDTSGQLFISDHPNNRIYKIDLSGILHLVVGNGSSASAGDGGPATAASIWDPSHIAFDPCGNLYISDVGGRRIRKVTFNPTSISTVSITVTPNDTVCVGTPVTYTATTTGGSTMSFSWYKNGVIVPGATTATYTYPATATEGGDSVRCVYTGVDICSFIGYPSSNTIDMVVTPLTAPTISLTSSPATSAAIGSIVTVNATVGSAGSSYSIRWYKNSVLFATTSTPTTTYTKSAGTDIITARVSSTAATGCYDTTTSAAHTINEGAVSVNEPISQHLEGIKLHPNPAHNVLTVTAMGKIQTISVSNSMGQSFSSIKMTKEDNHAVIDVASLPAGVYVVRVNGIYFQRFVKQ